jgi:hypothetical protein
MPTIGPTQQWIVDANPDAAARRGAGETTLSADARAELAEMQLSAQLSAWNPAVASAVSLCERGIAIAATSGGEVTAEPLRTRGDVVRHWGTVDSRGEYLRLRNHVAVRTGRHGHFAIVAVSCDTWSQWAGWRDRECSEEITKVDDYGKRVTRTEPRGLGHCAALSWAPPPPSEMEESEVMLGQEMVTRADLRAARQRYGDRGGSLVWAVPADRAGRLPTFGGRELADGVTVLPDGELLAWTAPVRGDGSSLTAEGIPDASVATPMPAWLAHLFGAKWR